MQVENTSKASYYKKRVDSTSNDFGGFLTQVGKTYLGKTIPESEFKIIISSIIKALDITNEDQVLDLGCANGLITYEISKYAKNVIGFDINKDLLRIANNNHKTENITYIQEDILNILFSQYEGSKFYMYMVLQYMEYSKFIEMLQKMSQEKKSFQLFIGDIPDQEKQLDFYHTKERRQYLFKELIENKKTHLGFWWYRQHILQICEDLSLSAEIIEQHPSLITSHYRFVVIITKYIII